MDPSHGLIWPQSKGQYNKSHLLQHGITWDFITLKVKRKLSKLCAARSLAANQQREAISTDVRMCDAISWGSCKGSCSSGDKKELVPKQRHVIEAELAPPKKYHGLDSRVSAPKSSFHFTLWNSKCLSCTGLPMVNPQPKDSYVSERGEGVNRTRFTIPGNAVFS